MARRTRIGMNLPVVLDADGLDTLTGSVPPPVDTDFTLTRQVGSVLHGLAVGSADIVGARVVAVCARHGGGLVITSDADDVERLAAAGPSARIVARSVR